MTGLLSHLNHLRLSKRAKAWLRKAERYAPLWLDLTEFQGRDVAIIGPAKGVTDELRKNPPDADTLIVRMNRSAAIAMNAPEDHGGSRTDLLFHMLKTDGDRGTGPLDRAAMARAGVRHIVYPHALPRKIKRRVIDMHAAFADGRGPDLRLPPLAVYAQLDADCAPHTPTTGATAIATVLAAKPAGLSIFGFSFFRTAYAPGYNDAITDATAAAWARGSRIHNPDVEARVLARRLWDYGNGGGRLTLGAGVADAMRSRG